MDNRNLVDGLIEMYARYKELSANLAQLSEKLAKQKAAGNQDDVLKLEHERLTQELQDLSDSMTFANPIVWMMYKYEAYMGEAQPILNMHDFRLHCSKPGYICTNRFIFLNEQLARLDYALMSDTDHYPDDMSLKEAFETAEIVRISDDADFRELWDRHEYHKDGSRVAKWEDFTPKG